MNFIKQRIAISNLLWRCLLMQSKTKKLNAEDLRLPQEQRFTYASINNMLVKMLDYCLLIPAEAHNFGHQLLTV